MLFQCLTSLPHYFLLSFAYKDERVIQTSFPITFSVMRLIKNYLSSFIFPLLFAFANSANAQTNISGVINTYAPVNEISFNTGITTTNCTSVKLTVGTRSGADPSFAVGDRVLLIQMKGAYPNVSNNANFGRVDENNGNSGLANAGNFEFSTVSDVVNVGGNQEVTLANSLVNIYDSPSFVQLIKVPVYATGARVLGAGVTAQPWSETTGVGGVISFVSSGTLTLNGNITADGLGFTGGEAVVDGRDECIYNQSYNSTEGRVAGKGEGIILENNNYARGLGSLGEWWWRCRK